jgi:hypothetical protein
VRPQNAAAALAALLVTVAAGGAAEARILDFRGGVRVGGMGGWGSSSTTPDFFNDTSGFGGGFELGAKLLIFDASASFMQIIDSHGTVGTLTQLLVGVVIDVPVGSSTTPRPRQGPGPNGQAAAGAGGGGGGSSSGEEQSRDIFRPGMVAGFGFGSAGPVMPPLTNDQISDKGFIAALRLGYEHFLTSFLGVGVQADVGYHYFLGGQVVTNTQDHSSGLHLVGLGTLTVHLGF